MNICHYFTGKKTNNNKAFETHSFRVTVERSPSLGGGRGYASFQMPVNCIASWAVSFFAGDIRRFGPFVPTCYADMLAQATAFPRDDKCSYLLPDKPAHPELLELPDSSSILTAALCAALSMH